MMTTVKETYLVIMPIIVIQKIDDDHDNNDLGKKNNANANDDIYNA